MVKLEIFLFFIGIIVNTKGDSDMNGTSACIIKTSGFCLPKGYEKFEGPEQTKGGPIHVKVKFMVQQITHINDDDFTISVSMSLHLYWEDPRITNLHSGSFQEEHHNEISNVFIVPLGSFLGLGRSPLGCFLRSRCSMQMWCPDDIGRDSWGRVVAGTCERT